MMSGIFVGDITEVLYFEFKKNLHSLSKLVKYRGVRRFFAFTEPLRNVYFFPLLLMEEVPVDMVKYPIIYRFFLTSKRWLALGFLNHQQISPPSLGQPVNFLRRQGIKQAFEEVVFKILDTPSLLQSTPRQWEGFECGGFGHFKGQNLNSMGRWVGVVQSWMLLLDFCSKALSFEAFSILFVPRGSYTENLTAQEEWCHVTLFLCRKREATPRRHHRINCWFPCD